MGSPHSYGARVVYGLQARGCEALLVEPDGAGRHDALQQLLQAGAPAAVLSVCGNGGAAAGDDPGDVAADSVRAAMLARAAAALAVPPKLYFVTCQAQQTDATTVDPAQSMVWGFARSLALEMPQLFGGLFDLDRAAMEGSAAALVDELMGNSAETQVAFRGSRRLLARLTVADVPASGGDVAIDPAGSYLVTGAFGAIGREVAAWLAEQGARRLVLVSRHAATVDAVALVRRLNEVGVEVVARSADVADRGQLQAVVDEIGADRPLKGVFHLAGVVADASILQMTTERFAAAIDAKVKGAWNLHGLTAGQPLDLFVLFSSAASVLGSPGQSNYAAANAFLDGLAALRRSLGLPGVSVNWGPWTIGMAAAAGGKGQRRLDAWGLGAMDAPHALNALPALCAQAAPHLVVLPAAWHPSDPAMAQRITAQPFFSRLVRQIGSAAPAAAGAVSDLAREMDALPASRRKAVLMSRVADAIRDVLGLAAGEDLDPRQGLFDLGMDSLSAVSLVEALRRSTSVAIPATLAFDRPTLAELTDFLFDALGLSDVVAEQLPAPGVEADHFDAMSETELVALLAQELPPVKGER
jgi:acyl carrier protein